MVNIVIACQQVSIGCMFVWLSVCLLIFEMCQGHTLCSLYVLQGFHRRSDDLLS